MAEQAEAAKSEAQRHGPWALRDHLLAGIFDGVNHLAWMWSEGGNHPEQFPRPGVGGATVTPINAFSRAVMDYMRENQGAVPPEGWQPDATSDTS